MTDLINESIYDEAVYRTATATPGPLYKSDLQEKEAVWQSNMSGIVLCITINFYTIPTH